MKTISFSLQISTRKIIKKKRAENINKLNETFPYPNDAPSTLGCINGCHGPLLKILTEEETPFSRWLPKTLQRERERESTNTHITQQNRLIGQILNDLYLHRMHHLRRTSSVKVNNE